MKKFKATFYGEPQLIETEITRETEQCVFYKRGSLDKERREMKSSQYHAYFDDRGDAKLFIVSKMRKKLENAQMRLDYAKEQLAEVEQL